MGILQKPLRRAQAATNDGDGGIIAVAKTFPHEPTVDTLAIHGVLDTIPPKLFGMDVLLLCDDHLDLGVQGALELTTVKVELKVAGIEAGQVECGDRKRAAP